MAALPGYYTIGDFGKGGGTKPVGLGTTFKVPAPTNGTFNNNRTISANRTTLSNIEDTGSIWGAAWKKGTKELFVAAALKRYVPLQDETSVAAVETSAGTIYKIDMSVDPAVVSSFNVIPNVLSAAASTDLSNRDYSYNQDLDIVNYAGRQGLGDLEISEDETKLYTVNLNTKELVIIDANSGALLQSVSIPNPYVGGECSADMVRPWALKVRGSDVFIGSVCEDEISNDVGAAIQKYNGAIFQTAAMSNSLRYLRPRTYGPENRSLGDGYRYNNWTNYYTDAPMLTDIEFTNSGDLVLGYNSRATYNRNGSLRGDIRKMCLNADGSYTDESTALAVTTCQSNVQNYSGNPTDYYEFYIGDYFGGNYGGSGHPDTASGALAQKPGASNIIVGMIDATDWYQPGAIGNYDNTTGDKIGAQAVIDKNKMTDGGEREAYGSKAGGMGDVELLCDPAPVEVGNYVWVDVNQDGIQDPNEPPFANVPVTLICNATTYGTTTTDSNGHFYFGGLNNVNIGANTLQAGDSCELRIAQADVNNKPPTVTDPNGNSEDQRDNDAVASGLDNVITFTVGVSSDHSLDFGITPTVGCLTGTLFLDNNNNGILDGTDTTAPAGITLTVNDAFGGTHTAQTDGSGAYAFASVPAGNVTVSVDTTDTDIPEGAVFSAFTTSTTINEGTIPTCTTEDFGYLLPAPTAQDPRDVAVCANPTSITWDGATVSTATIWQDMLTTPLNSVSTAGGTTVNVSMSINNPDNEFYDTDVPNSSGSGTSAAFGQPYLTLYLGDQTAPGDGNWQNSDSAGCASHGYDLESGERAELVVDFDQEVVLDNWRIRDVDSGDVRSAVSDWEWQDGIKVEGFDAAGNPVAIETKIGSSGAGLIKDAQDIVHTDSSTYDAGSGDFATGGGTVPNSTNGHIVLTSNFVPVSRIVITHEAGPDMPCQTRSALAMAGLAVCVPLHVSGNVYNDEDGVAPAGVCSTSDDTVDGTPVNNVEGTPLNACLLDSTNIVVDTQAVAGDGSYDFDTNIRPNTNYKVLLTENNCTVGEASPAATLLEGWNYEGEQIDPTNNTGHDGTPDGLIDVAVATSDVTDVDFGINKTPTAQGYDRPYELNPGATASVQFDLSGSATSAYINDNEEGIPAAIEIIAISGGTLYNGATQVNVNDIITNPDFSQLQIDPDGGDVTATFEYRATDSACRVSNPALFTAPFTTLNIAGNLFLDMTRDDQVNGTATPNSCDGSTPLYVNLVDTNGDVLSSITLAEDGSYAFYYDDGVRANTSYTVVLSQTQGVSGSPVPAATLPNGCANLDGENIESLNPGTTDGTADGMIAVSVGTENVTEINFAITPTVRIGNRVWIEDDNDGDATTGNITPVVGATVTAVCTDGTHTTTTDTSGLYSIELPANIGQCTVSVATPTNTSPATGSNDNDVLDTTTENDKTHDGSGTTVNVGMMDNLTLDFGFASVGNLCGSVTEDTNDDDTGDVPIENVTLTLFDALGNQVGTTQTASDGTYCFNNLVAGDYIVRETQPAGLADVSENEGGADNDAADNNEDNAISATVSAGETDMNNDFVEEKTGNLCGRVTEDIDNDDTGDQPIENVTLTLFDATGSQVGTTLTDSDGQYCFNDLVPGEYTVVETQPSGMADVSENEGGTDGDRTDTTLNSLQAYVSPGETDLANDFVEEDAATAYRIGDLFWIDSNSDGVYTSGEEVIAGATVELLNANGDVIGTTVTDANGRYNFNVPAGEYKVRFHIPQSYIDEGFQFVTERVDGDDTNKVLSDGVVEVSAVVGPNTDQATQVLTLDAGISCGCDDAPIQANGGDALGFMSMMLMMLLTLGTALFFVRQEEQKA
jgi:protocatechuate 3,4-dioxygenase beta subunit